MGHHDGKFTLDQITFCARECERQRSGELSVAHMCEAMSWALACNPPLIEGHIRLIAHTVLYGQPRGDLHLLDYRIGPAVFWNGGTAARAEQIRGRMDRLLHVHEIVARIERTEEEREERARAFYRDFEWIHPFEDGNGRTGAILYNWLRGSLDRPIAPPEYQS